MAATRASNGAAPRQTSTALSAIGSGATLDRGDARRPLALSLPAQTDREAAGWLMQSYGIAYAPRGAQRAGEPSHQLTGPQANYPSARRDLAALFEPAPREAIAEALAVVSVLTATNREGAAADLTLSAYCAKLSAYPADVAMTALRTWADHNKFFPTWAELRQACEQLVWWRRELMAALVAATEADRA